MRLAASALLLLAGCHEYTIHELELIDVFDQDPAEAVDVLLVVDDSCSMSPYQVRLGASFHELLTGFVDANVDYQIGVTTTTVAAPSPTSVRPECEGAPAPTPGHLVDGVILRPDTPDAAALFQQLVQVGDCGSDVEMGLEAARRAVSPELLAGPNAGFLREEASLSVLFVSDEEDLSPDPVHRYLDDLFTVKGHRSRDVFNASALAVLDLDDCDDATGSSVGTRYIDMAAQTGGVAADLCSEDFGPIIEDLSLHASRLRDTFFLSQDPDPTTLAVTLEDDALPCEGAAWTYARPEGEAPRIVFAAEAIPPPGARVAVRYNPGSGDPAYFCGGTP